MSSFSTRGLLAILTGPAQRILQDVQVFGLKAGVAEQPTAGSGDERGGVEDVQSSPPAMEAPAGVIRGVRAVAPTSASSSMSRGPGPLREERVQGPGLPRGMGTASELVRPVPASETPPSEPTEATSPLPRLILRREGPRPSVPRAPARAVAPLSSPPAVTSEVPAGVTPRFAVAEAPVRVPEAPGGAAAVHARGLEERGMPVRFVSGAEARPPAVTAQAPREVSVEDVAPRSLVSTAVPHGMSVPVSSEPPRAPASERPGAQGLPRLVIRRASVPSTDSRPRVAVASVQESRVLTPEPRQPPRVTPSGTSEARGSLEPSAAVQPGAESTFSRRERGEGIPLTPRGSGWSSRGPVGLGAAGQAAPVPEWPRLAPGELASVKLPPLGAGLPAPVSAPLASTPPGASARPTFTPPPESFLRDGASSAPLTAEALPPDRERIEELLVDILQAAARGEGVEV